MSLRDSASDLMKLLGGNIAVKVVGILSLGFFTRSLSMTELAVLPVYDMLKSLSIVLFGCGIQPTIIRTLPALLREDRESAQGFINLTSAISVAAGLAFMLVVIIFAEPLARVLLNDPSRAKLLRIGSCGFLLFTVRNTLFYLLWASSRFGMISIVRITNALGRSVLGVGGYLLAGIEGLVIGFVINDVIGLLITAYAARDFFRRATSRPSLRSLLRKSLPFAFESYLMYFKGQGDNWIVAAALGPAAMSIYFVARRFPELLQMFMESFDKIVTTELSKQQNDPTAVRNVVQVILGPLVTVAVPGVFLLIGLLPTLILIVSGPGFEAAISTGMILCLVQLVRIIAVPVNRGVFVTRSPSTRVRITTFEAAVLLVSLVALAPLFAEQGVALARLVSSIALIVGGLFAVRSNLHITLPWQRILYSLVISCLMTAVLLAGQAWKPGIIVLPLWTLGGIIVFLSVSRWLQSHALAAALDVILPFEPPAVLQRIIGRSR